MLKKRSSLGSTKLNEMAAAQSNQSSSSSSSASNVATATTTPVQSGMKHKYHFKFIVNALEILPERPVSNTNSQTNSSSATTPTIKTSIGTFFKQFSEAPKVPRTGQLEWKRNARKRGKLPVCRFQKSIDQNKSDHFIFYTREEKSFEFYTRLTTSSSSSSGYKDKFLRISLEQLQDEAFAASPPTKLLSSKKRICEEEINLVECIQTNGMERNLVLMEVTQNGLSQLDSTIIAAKKLKKKSSIFNLKLGDDQENEVVAYLVLRYTIVCTTNDAQPTLSTSFVSNEITDDTEVSMTEPEVSDDEEGDEDTFKSPRVFSQVTSHSEVSEPIVNTPSPLRTVPPKEVFEPETEEVESDSLQPTAEGINPTSNQILNEIHEPLPNGTANSEVKPEIVPEKPETVSEPVKNEQEEGSNFFWLSDEEEEAESKEVAVVHQTPEKEEPVTVPQTLEKEVEPLKNENDKVDTKLAENEPVLIEEPSPIVTKKPEPVVIVEKEPEESQSFLDLEEEESIEEKPINSGSTFVNSSTLTESVKEEAPIPQSEIKEPESLPEITHSTEGDGLKSSEDESDFDIIYSPNEESTKSHGTIEKEVEIHPPSPIKHMEEIVPINTPNEEPVTIEQPIVEVNIKKTSIPEKPETPEAPHEYSSDEDMFSPVNSTNHFSDHVDKTVITEPTKEKVEALHTKILEEVISETPETISQPVTNSAEYDEMRKQSDELLTVLDMQKQKIIELENYSNSFHPLIVSIIWGLVCSLLYSVSQVEVSAVRPILVATFYTIVVYFGVQLTRAMKFYNYGTHLTNYLREMRFLKKLENIPKKDIGKLGTYIKKYITSEDFRFLDDLFRSASWGALFGVGSLILKALFSSSDDSVADLGDDGIIYRFFVSGILYKCLYRSVTEELFERLFCLLFSVFIFNEFNLTIKIRYFIDKYTNPKHAEQYKSLSDFESQQKPTTSKTGRSVLSLPHYTSVILATVISTIFSIGQPARHTFTTDSFIFDKVLGSFVFSYMFVVQEKIELCMVAHFTKNFIDVVFAYY